ncbi:hypothetical protein GCM10027031_11810 [Corynebacterium atrinae]
MVGVGSWDATWSILAYGRYVAPLPNSSPHPDVLYRVLLEALAGIGKVPSDEGHTEDQLARFVFAWDACPTLQVPTRRPFPGRLPGVGWECPSAPSGSPSHT